MAGPLTGFRILDLSERAPAAAIAGMMLADLGAELIRVEPVGGDPIRQLEGVGVWLRGQRSLTVGPDQLADGSWAALRASADAILQTVQPWADKPAGLLDGWDEASGQVLCLLTQQPRSVAEALADAQQGAGAPVYGELMEAEYGFCYWQQGVRPEGPTFMGFPHATYGAAWQLANGTLGALYERERTGRGQVLTTSLVDGMAILANHRWQSGPGLGDLAMFRKTQIGRNGNARMVVALFECSDGIWVQVHTGARGSWDRLVIAMGRPELIMDEGAAELAPELADAVWSHLTETFRTQTSDHWREWLAEADVPCMPALPPGRSLLLEQIVANGQVDIAPDGTRRFGKVAKYSRTPLALRREVPAPGQDNADLLATPQQPVRRPAGKQRAAASERVGPLDGVLVVDFGAWMAGPFSPRNLADLGARVIKVEELVGDPMRRPRIDGFLGVQRGKEGVAVNLKTEEGRRIAHELVRRADIVHHNVRLPAAKRLGIDYETLRQVNPSIIYCHSSGYGNDGPWSQLPTFEPLHSALTGMLNRTGGRGNMPMHYMTHMDYGCGLTSTVTVLAALLERERSGLGQHLEVPQIGAGLLAQSDVQVHDGEVNETFGLDHQQLGHAPTNALYRTADGWMMLACGSDREWRGVAQALKLEAGTLPGFQAARRERMEDSATARAVRDALTGLTTAEAKRRLDAAGVPCAEPRRYWAEDATADPLLRRHGVVLAEHQPEAGDIYEVAHTVRFGSATRQHHRPAPGLGEHTVPVLRELGRSDAQIEALVAQGVILTGEVPAGVR